MEIRYRRVSWTFNEVGWDMYVPTFEMWRPRIFLYRCRRGYTHILVSPLLFVLLYHPPRHLGVNNNELGVCSDFKRVLSPFSSCPLLSSAWQSLRFWFPAFSLSCEPVMTARPTTCHLPLATCNPPRLDHSSLQPKPVSRTQFFLSVFGQSRYWNGRCQSFALQGSYFFHDFNTTRLTGLPLQGYVLHFLGSYTLLQHLKLEQQISGGSCS